MYFNNTLPATRLINPSGLNQLVSIKNTCVLYTPFWKYSGASFPTDDQYHHTCSVTGAVKVANGRAYDGIDDFITVPNHPALSGLSKFTFAAWCYFDAVNNIDCIISKDTDGDGSREWYFRRDVDGKLLLVIYDSNGVGAHHLQVRDATPLSGSTWHFVTASWNGINEIDNIIITVDDEIRTLDYNHKAGNGAESYNSTSDIEIGRGSAQNNITAYHGVTGECFIFTPLLTHNEKKVLRHLTKWRY